MAAREGGPDPAANLALANAIEKARSLLDAEGQHRARDRAAARARTPTPTSFEQVVYEGYGPNGVAVIVEALTDNRNRTAADVRAAFAKHDGNLGGSGAVAWLFERRGVILVDADRVDEDELTLAAAEGGAEDVEQRRLELPRHRSAGGPDRACARRSRQCGHRGRARPS